MSRRRYISSRAGAPAVGDLPAAARAVAEFPYSRVTEANRQYHLRAYESWCTRLNATAWPLALPTLLAYAVDAARTKAYLTVRAHILVVSMVERKRSGRDLARHPTITALLTGLKRDKPPQPPRPLKAEQIERLFSYEPESQPQQATRSLLLLTYTAGITLTDHIALRCEMISFEGERAIITGLNVDRPSIVIGAGRSSDRCPVQALRHLSFGRKSGPIYISVRGRTRELGGMQYYGLADNIRYFGLAAGVKPLSNERVRLAGMIEQSRNIDAVRLAQFHGYRSVENISSVVGRHIDQHHRYKRREP